MRVLIVCMILCAVMAVSFGEFRLLHNNEILKSDLIQSHVAADSGSEFIQNTVFLSFRKDLINLSDIAKAKEYLEENLPKIPVLVNKIFRLCGINEIDMVMMCREAFHFCENEMILLSGDIYTD